MTGIVRGIRAGKQPTLRDRHKGRGVHEQFRPQTSRNNWRTLDGSAATYVLAKENLESRIEWVLRPGQWRFCLITKPAEMLSFYPGVNR
jgi:hypothetical protein